MATELPAEILAKDSRIDTLISEAAGLVDSLNDIAANLRETLDAVQKLTSEGKITDPGDERDGE